MGEIRILVTSSSYQLIHCAYRSWWHSASDYMKCDFIKDCEFVSVTLESPPSAEYWLRKRFKTNLSTITNSKGYPVKTELVFSDFASLVSLLLTVEDYEKIQSYPDI